MSVAISGVDPGQVLHQCDHMLGVHVAAVKIIGASHFLTFNANRKKPAEAEDLIVPH